MLFCIHISTIYFLCKCMGINLDIYSYANPLIILSSVSFLLCFSKMKIKYNPFVNWIAKSSFAVFLIQTHPNIKETYFKELIRYIYENMSGLSCLCAIFLTLICIFMGSIILDQPRKWIWNMINPFIHKVQLKYSNC